MQIKPTARALLNFATLTWLRRSGVTTPGPVTLYGHPRIRCFPGSRIQLGRRVALNNKWQTNDLDAPNPCILRTLTKNARIEIGDDSGLTSATVSCAMSIRIGDRVLIGSGVVITDSDHHYVEVDDVTKRRSMGRPNEKLSHAVVIGDDVFVGARSLILKGSTIGPGAVIGAGSVVSGHVPENAIFAGNPARLIRYLNL